MSQIIDLIVMGVTFGLIAGLAPGPIIALVISESLKRGKIAGFKIALANVVTEIPILIILLLIHSKLDDINGFAAIISLIGGAYLIYLGCGSLISSEIKIKKEKDADDSFKKAVIALIFNPHVYLFYFLVAAPTVLNASKTNITAAIMFYVAFIGSIMSVNVITSLIVARFRHFLGSRSYVIILKLLGLALIIFGIIFIKNGIGMII